MQARKSLIATLALSAAAGSATPALAGSGAGQHGTSQCQRPGDLSYQDAEVEVWAQDAPNAHVNFVACWRATGRTVTALDFDNDCVSASSGCDDVYPKVRKVVRAGSWRALYVDNDASGAAIALADVRAGTTPRPAGYTPRDAPRELVVGRNGVLAWISDYVTKEFRRSRELRLCDTACLKAGAPARRRGRGPKLSRLRLKDGRVYWSDGERTRSAPTESQSGGLR
jgi:hypothetical protein